MIVRPPIFCKLPRTQRYTFSEDDTMIASLDKTGRLRLWDIRDLTDETNATAARVNPVKVDMPLLSLMTASPS